MSTDREAGQPRRILVVIPTLNEARTIDRVLDSLSRELPAPSIAQTSFVVVDGGSTDGTAEKVKALARERADLKLLSNPKRIQSAAVNLAVRRYGDGTDVLVRCDAHAEYPAGYVRMLDEALQATGASAVVVPMDSVGESGFQRAVAWASNSFIGTGGSAHRAGRESGFVDHGHHAAFKMDSFCRAGGYDESYSHNEDAELDCRQRELGGQIWLDAGIRIVYRPRSTPSSLARQYFAYGKGRSRTVRRHPASMRPRQLAVPLHVAFSALCLLVSPWLPLALLWPAFYVAVLAFVSVQTAREHHSRDGLWTGVAAGIMHTAWAAGFLTGLLTVREKPWLPQSAVASGAQG